MTKKVRDTVTYNLRDGKRVVYKGTTNDTERREKEHKNENKQFTRLETTSRKMTSEGAKKKEAQDLEQYRKSHGGENPDYNKDSDG